MKLPPEEIAELRKLRGEGMISAVGEYTPDEFWDALDEIERLRAENAQLREIATTFLPVMDAMRPLVLNLERLKDAAQHQV